MNWLWTVIGLLDNCGCGLQWERIKYKVAGEWWRNCSLMWLRALVCLNGCICWKTDDSLCCCPLGPHLIALLYLLNSSQGAVYKETVLTLWETLTHQSRLKLFHAEAEPNHDISKHWKLEDGPHNMHARACVMNWYITTHNSFWSFMLSEVLANGLGNGFSQVVFFFFFGGDCCQDPVASGWVEVSPEIYVELFPKWPMSSDLFSIRLLLDPISQCA